MKALKVVFRVMLTVFAALGVWFFLFVLWAIFGDTRFAVTCITVFALSGAANCWEFLGGLTIFGGDGDDGDEGDEGDEATERAAVVDPSYIGRRVDAEELVEAIQAGMRLRDKGECKVGGLWVFRDDPILPDPGQPGVIRISTFAPDDEGSGEWEPVEDVE